MQGNTQEQQDFKNTPEGQYSYWDRELSASKKMLKSWHKLGDKVVGKYLGKPLKGKNEVADESISRINLFHSNISTLESMLYGNTPKIDVSRRYADAQDDVARVAAEMMERLLNLDMASRSDEIDAVFKSVLQDRLLPGLGCARVRYTYQSIKEETDLMVMDEEKGVEVAQTTERLVDEDVPVEYWFWGDVLWSWARNWSDVRWVAFRNYLSKEEVLERFGEEAADGVNYTKQVATAEDEGTNSGDDGDESENMKAEIWEIWNKQRREVVWVSEGYNKVLSTQQDPLKLLNFFPCPPFLLANPTTAQLMPTPDFKLAEDLYNEVDVLHHRITILTQAVKAVGCYDQAKGTDLARIYDEGVDNKMIPVDSWAMFAEKGGLAGAIDFVPISEVVNALDKLRELRAENIGLLQQVTGMADVMRGEVSNQYEGVGQSQLKAKFGSVRVQGLQEQFATFASGLMQLKAEVISRHFSPETIVRKANMGKSVDAEVLPQAVRLVKNPEQARLRTIIRPESVAMIDYTSLQEERVSFINALATFMQSSAPMMDADPSTTPFLLQLLQWSLSGFKGAQEIEGVIDKAIQTTIEAQQQAQANPQPSEAEIAAQQEAAKQQGELAKIQAKAESDMQLRMQDMQADIQTSQQAHQQKMAEIFANMQSKLAEIEAKMQADIAVEQVQAEANVLQTQVAGEIEMEKDALNAELESASKAEDAANEINKIKYGAQAKINEAVVKNKAEMRNTSQTSEPNTDNDV